MKVSQRPGAVREHEHEPVHGLPEELPADERVLWQGAPDWRALAIRAFHVRKLVVYFALMLALRGSVVLADGGSALDAIRAVATLAPLALLGIGLTLLIAWLSARSTAASDVSPPSRTSAKASEAASAVPSAPRSCEVSATA